MSSSAAISSDTASPNERRGSSRGVLHHYVVLVYFGEDNWGRLTNMSESGMAFEFSRPPSLHARVNFTFQVMGCMPVPEDASVLGESFEAAGEIVWLREFERIAGVHFVDLTEGNRKHIRQWLAFEASTDTLAARERAKEEVLPLPADTTEVSVPLGPATESEAISKADAEEGLARRAAPETLPEPEPEAEESRLTAAMTEAPPARLSEQDEPEEWEPGSRSSPSSQPSVARLTFLVVSGCLAAFAATAGVRIYMARAAHRADAAETALAPATGGEPAGEASVSSPGAPPLAATGSEAAPPFQVEVVDESGKRWMLWFVNKDSEKGIDQISRRTESESGAAKRKDTAQPEEPGTPHTFTLEAPNVNRSASDGSAANNPSAEAPAIQKELTVPDGQPIGGALEGSATPPAPVIRAPIGGMVQMARLVHSVPPVYPSLAKSSRVSGDVVVDALIDANGNVKTTKVLSGPVMLQQAATETVRQWKYEPARLDGQAVAMHLTVTVKFRMN